MKKHITTIVFLLVVVFSLHAQTSFKAGFVIQNSGDTVRGFISQKEWSVNPHKIIFKKELFSQEQIFSPNDIKYFHVGNELYIGKTVNYIERPGSEETKVLLEPKIKNDAVFLSVLVKGRMNLLYLTDDDKEEHFFIANDTLLEELVSRSTYRYDNGVKREVKINKYIGQLVGYLGKGNDNALDYVNARYNYKDLIRIFSNYNTHADGNQQYVSNIIKNKTKISLIFTGGINISSLKISSSESSFDYLTKNKFNSSFAPQFGIGVNFNFLKYNYRWSYYIEMNLAPYKFNTQYTVDDGIPYNKITRTKFNLTYLKISNNLKYHFLKERTIKPYFLGGFAFEKLIHTNSNSNSVINIYSATYTNSTDPLGAYQTIGLSLFAGVGLNYKNFIFEYRFNSDDGFSPLKALLITHNTHSILIGYSLDISKKIK